MERKSARIGVALTVACLATGGLALLNGGPAQAAAPSQPRATNCSYVTIRATLVREGPNSHDPMITELPKGTHISATCSPTQGWVSIIRPETFHDKHIKGGWVPIHDLAPNGGASAGGGGTSRGASSLPATGLGLVTLGSGVALLALRRRTTVPSA